MNEKENECRALATCVRQQGKGSTVTDLVFDPVTGEFRQIEAGETPTAGAVVTEMTKDGFAAEELEAPTIVYANKEELKAFVQGEDTCRDGFAYQWEGEGVVHVHLTPLKHAQGKQVACRICKGTSVPSGTTTPYAVTVQMVNGAVTANLHRQTDGYAQALACVFVPARAELYSRNKGLLEKDVLAQKRVLIVGLGSFGSQIAIELAKAGVGSFALCDFDRVELHNLARHTGTVADLGRLKTDVVADAVWGKNPYAEVEKVPVDINTHLDVLAREVDKADLVICATDNNQSRFHLTQTLEAHPKVCIFGRAVTRAEGGDVFVARPGGACYNCLIGNSWYESEAEEVSSVQAGRRSGRVAAYVSDADAEAVVQVGLSADIAPICNMMVKLALVELSRGTDSGITALEQELVYNYYLWANRRERKYANWSALPGAGNRPTILRWYGAQIKRNPSCALCGEALPHLDEGETLVDRVDLSDCNFSVNLGD